MGTAGGDITVCTGGGGGEGGKETLNPILPDWEDWEGLGVRTGAVAQYQEISSLYIYRP